ncbi:MAG: lyase family protein [Pseudomonadota bacterium]
MENSLYRGLFGDEEISTHLSAEAEIAAMIRVERALARAQASAGVIPKDMAQTIDQGLKHIEVAPVDLIAGTTQSGIPVPGLVAALRAALPPEAAHWVHWGATTQDIMDNGLVLRLALMLRSLESRLHKLTHQLADMADAHATLPMAGRTRSQIATPITYGLRVAQWMHPLLDLSDRIPAVKEGLKKVQCGGASGANSAIAPDGPAVMEALAKELGLAPSQPWHTNRVILADLSHWCATLTAALASMAGDITLMLRREIGELRLQGGGGSSTMPNKTNPVQAEVMMTLGRRVSGLTASANLAVQHTEERDGPAWMQEWLVLPQILIGTGAALNHAIDLIANISPDSNRMAANLALDGGAAQAETASFALAKHMPRAEAQALVKKAASAAREHERSLIDAVKDLAGDVDLELDMRKDAAIAGSAEIVAQLVDRARA